VRALAFSFLATPLTEIIATLHHFHLLIEVDFPPFVDDFHLKMFVLDRKAFIFALTRLPCLSFGSSSNMVYEFLQDYFIFDILMILIFFLKLEAFDPLQLESDLSIGHPHTIYLIQGYICKAF
jgi:hypothetical protein